jgi:hypothetical protein
MPTTSSGTPQAGSATVVAPVGADGNRPAFVVGPNPVSKSIGSVGIFYQGKPISSGTLAIYDATGNVVRKIKITDVGALRATPSSDAAESRRQIGTWDLRDTKGRLVSEGTYLVRGTVKTVDGRREKVSAVVGVR